MRGEMAFAEVHSKPEKRLDLQDRTGELTLDFTSAMGDRVRHWD